MNCPKCNSTILAHHRFCANCGNELEPTSVAPALRSEERMDTGLLAVGAALLICCGFFFVLH